MFNWGRRPANPRHPSANYAFLANELRIVKYPARIEERMKKFYESLSEKNRRACSVGTLGSYLSAGFGCSFFAFGSLIELRDHRVKSVTYP